MTFRSSRDEDLRGHVLITVGVALLMQLVGLILRMKEKVIEFLS